MKSEPLLTKTQKLLRQSGLHARKGLGQNFLIDEDVLNQIISTAGLSAEDLVIEVGPGLGVLTEELAKYAGRVVAIELDDNLAALLKERLSGLKNVVVINRDILKTDLTALLSDYKTTKYKVVANLPYYITSPVLRHFLESDCKPESMIVMVQKEVAEEIAAKPGKMSLLSIGVQLYGQPEIITKVPAESFYPAPKVDSAVLKVIPYAQPRVQIDDREGFFKLVRAGFASARKQLANSLAKGLEITKEESMSLLGKAGIDSQRRAETLAIEEWAGLWRIFAALQK
jgi:16S rRNA (adenine1518-N6/adenine1519-N6)-dimethyltransferase